MAKKKQQRKTGSTPSLSALQKRVSMLERDLHCVKEDVGSLADEVVGLKAAVKQVDARSGRAEKMLNEMQLEQCRSSRMIDRIAEHFALKVEPPVVPSADPGDEAPPDADEPE